MLPKYAKSLFYVQNEQNETPQFVKRVPKSKFSILIDHSVIFTQICPKLQLYKKRAKNKAHT